MKLTLTQVKVFPAKDKSQSDRIGIKCQEYGDKWLSGFIKDPDPRVNWKVGQQVEWEVKPNGEYLNLVDPPKTLSTQKGLSNALEKIFDKLEKIEQKIDNLKVAFGDGDEEISVDEIPL